MFPEAEMPHQACSRCLTYPPAEPQLPFLILNRCLLMLAPWSCGRRGSVVQAQRQIHRVLRAAFTIAEIVVRSIAQQPALAVPPGASPGSTTRRRMRTMPNGLAV